MGDISQLRFIERHAASLCGPFLEVGSKDYGSTQNLRALFAARGEYVGIDQAPGPGVDLVLDLTAEFAEVDCSVGGRRFGTVFCLSVLEHCAEPFRMAENLTRLLRPGGRLCVAAPFAFKYHPFPDDFWRFTHQGIRRLFPQIDFRADDAAIAVGGRLMPLDDDLGRIVLSAKAQWKSGRIGRGLSAGVLNAMGQLGLCRWLLGHRYLMPPTQVLMIGTRPTNDLRS